MEQLGEMKYFRERKWGTELILIVQCKKERQEVGLPKVDNWKSIKGQGRIGINMERNFKQPRHPPLEYEGNGLCIICLIPSILQGRVSKWFEISFLVIFQFFLAPSLISKQLLLAP